MVYLITFGDRKYCKIGHTKDVGKRIASMQTSLPLEIELLSVIEGGCDTEKDIHLIFNEFRRHGEWFEFNSIIEDYFYKRMSEDMLELSKKGVLVEYYKTIKPSDSVAKITNLDKMVLDWCASKSNKGNSRIYLQSIICKEAAQEIGIKYSSFRGSIRKLAKTGHLNRVGCALYEMSRL